MMSNVSTADHMSADDDDNDVVVMNGGHNTRRSSPTPAPSKAVPKTSPSTSTELRRTTRTRSSGSLSSAAVAVSPSPPLSTSPSPPATSDGALSRKRSIRNDIPPRANGANNKRHKLETPQSNTQTPSPPPSHVGSNGVRPNAKTEPIAIDIDEEPSTKAETSIANSFATTTAATIPAVATSAASTVSSSALSSVNDSTQTLSFSFEPQMTFLPPERVIIPSLTVSADDDESDVDADAVTADDAEEADILDDVDTHPPGFRSDLTNILPRPPLLPMSRYPHAFLTVWARYMQSVHRPMEGHIVQVQNKRVSAYNVYRSVVFLGGYAMVNRHCLWHECMMGILETAPSTSVTSDLPPVAPLTAHTFKVDPLQPKSFIQSYYEHYLYHFEQTYQWQQGFAPKYDLNKSIATQMKQANYGVTNTTASNNTTNTSTTTTSSISLATPATTVSRSSPAGISLEDLRLKIMKSVIPPTMHTSIIKAYKLQSHPTNTTAAATTPATATTTAATTIRTTTSTTATTTTTTTTTTNDTTATATDVPSKSESLGYAGMRYLLYSLRSMLLSEVSSTLDTLLVLSQRIANSPTEFRCVDSELIFDLSDNHNNNNDNTNNIIISEEEVMSDRERDSDDASDNGLIFYFDIISALIPLLMYSPYFRQCVDDEFIIKRDKQAKINERIKKFTLISDNNNNNNNNNILLSPQTLPSASLSLLSLQVDEKMSARKERWPDVHTSVLVIIENLSLHSSNTRRIARHISFINLCFNWLDFSEERRLLYTHLSNNNNNNNLANETLLTILRILTNISEWLNLKNYSFNTRLFSFIHHELAYYLHKAIEYNEKYLLLQQSNHNNDNTQYHHINNEMDEEITEMYETIMQVLTLLTGLCLSPYRRDNMRVFETYLLKSNTQTYENDNNNNNNNNDDDNLNDFIQILFLLCGNMHFMLPIRESMHIRQCATQALMYLTSNSHVVYQFIFVSCSPLLNLILIQNLLIHILKDQAATNTNTTTTTAASTAPSTGTNSPTAAAAAADGTNSTNGTNHNHTDTAATSSNSNGTSHVLSIDNAAVISDIQHLRRHSASLLYVLINYVLRETDSRLKAIGQRWIFSIEGEIFAAIMNDWDVSHILGGTLKQLAAIIQEEEEKNV